MLKRLPKIQHTHRKKLLPYKILQYCSVDTTIFVLNATNITGNLDMVDEQGRPRGHQHGGAAMHWGPFWPFNGYERTKEDR